MLDLPAVRRIGSPPRVAPHFKLLLTDEFIIRLLTHTMEKLGAGGARTHAYKTVAAGVAAVAAAVVAATNYCSGRSGRP